MKRLLIYFYLQLKRLIKTLPSILIGAIALSLVAGLIAFCGEKIFSEQSTESIKVKVALVFEDDSALTKMLVEMLEDTKCISDSCTFIKTDTKKALKLVKSGNAECALIIPKDFAKSVQNGKNYPIEVVFSDNGSIVTLVLKQLSCAGADILSAAQAGIYTQYDFYSSNNLLVNDKTANEYLNQTYLKYVLQREKMFYKTSSVINKKISISEYYICSGISLIILFIGMSAPAFFAEENKVFYAYSTRRGIPFFAMALIKILLFSFLLSIISEIFLYTTVEYSGGFKMFPAMLLSSCLTIFIYQISSNSSVGIILLFVINFSQSFISGYFLPSVFYPEALQNIGNVLPSGLIFSQIKDILTDCNSSTLLLYFEALIIYSLTLFANKALNDSRSFNLLTHDYQSKKEGI